jgi:hypothetical protein
MDRVELVMRDYGMSISKTGPKVIRYQIRVVREDGLRSFPLSKQTENEFDGDAQAVGTLSRLALRRSVEIVTKIDRAVGRYVLPSVCG